MKKEQKDPIIRTKGLKMYYTVGGNTVKALDGVDLEIKKGEFICVSGRSGSGKTTFLNMLAGLDPPTEGEIVIGGWHMEKMSEETALTNWANTIPKSMRTAFTSLMA